MHSSNDDTNDSEALRGGGGIDYRRGMNSGVWVSGSVSGSVSRSGEDDQLGLIFLHRLGLMQTIYVQVVMGAAIDWRLRLMALAHFPGDE